jgi:hypothetical protein
MDMYKMARLAHQQYAKDKEILKAAILTSLGESIQDEISQPVVGLADITIPEILAYVSLHFGCPTDADYRALMVQMVTPFNSDATFRSESGKLTKIFSTFATNGNPKSEIDKMMVLEQVTRTLPGVTRAIDTYKSAVDRVDWRYGTMVSHIIRKLPNYMTTGDLGYAAAATIEAQPTTLAIQIAAAVGEAMAAYHAQMARVKDRTGGEFKAGAKDRRNSYCWVHEYVGTCRC